MNFFFSGMQALGWMGVGYNIHANNKWAIFGFIMFTLVMGLASAMDMIGKQLRNDGNTSK
jgi:hypothetical protein